MRVAIHNITFDCADAHAQAHFWSQLTGWNVYYDDDPEVVVAPRFPHDGTGLLFIPVPEGKTAKNRVHLDLRKAPGVTDPAERMRLLEVECDRLVGLGATRLTRHEPGGLSLGFIVLRDPEGNEFCLD